MLVQDNKQYIVYIATNIINGHRYIGFTSAGLQKRKKDHIRNSKYKYKRYKFHNAICKYGKEAFTWKVFAIFNTANEALAEEMRLISELKPEYNISAGGEGTLGVIAHNRRSVTCLEDGKTFASMRDAAKFYKLAESNLFKVCSGERRVCKNLHFIFGDKLYSEDERKMIIQKIDIQHKRKINTAGPMKLAKKVLCLDDGKIYLSISEAARHYNVCTSVISSICSKKKHRYTANGLRFKYETV